MLEITYVEQCLCLKDDDNIDPIRGNANYGQSDTRKKKDETSDQMAQAIKALQQQVLHLANQLATTSAPNVKVEPTPVPRVRQNITSVHVKAEPNAQATTIDLVSSDEDVSDNESSIDTSRKGTRVPPTALQDNETTGAQLPTSQERTMVPTTALPDNDTTDAQFPTSQKRKMVPRAVQHDWERSADRYEEKAMHPRQKEQRPPLRTPFYTKGKQRRDNSIKNWEGGMKRNAKFEGVKAEVAQSTADNLPKILENMRVTGFGVIRNFKRVTRQTSLHMESDSSDDDEGASTERYQSVFQACNEPDAAQANYPHTPGWNASGSGKTPKHGPVFEGVSINSKDYEFRTRMSRPEVYDRSDRQPRQTMAPKSAALDAYNEKYIGQMHDIIKGMFANERPRPGYDPANPINWMMAQNVVWGGMSHQHPHCDQGKAGTFNTEQIFPFVCIHGFGLHEFVMWLLPARKKREYGFPFRFPKNAMLFMRGDCIHAGAYSQLTRGHLEFWPTAAAGWTRSRYPFWCNTEAFAQWQAKKIVFLLPDLRTFPFAFPEISDEDENGNQTVTYPVQYTEELFPHLDDDFKSKKLKKAKPEPVTQAALTTLVPAEQLTTNPPPTAKRVAEKEPRHARKPKTRRK
jgi:hypothetical protein